MPPIKLPPHRTPLAVSEALKDILSGQVVCELGCAEGDNMEAMAKYAKKVIGFEFDPRRYQEAQKRGLNVVVGDYYKDPLPEADVYYFWPDDGERDSEYLVQKILAKPGFSGTIIIGGDPGFPPEIPSLHRCAELGELIKVPYNEGPGPRQNGVYEVVVIDAKKLPQQCVYILSAPRSGSSCTTACLEISGINLGKTVTTVKDTHNEKGYFENQHFLTFNEKVLRATNSSIVATTPLNTIQILKSIEFKDELKKLIKSEFGEAKFFAIKDPRINILQALYTEALKELGIKPSAVILTRKKEHATLSLNKMTGVPLARAEKSYDLHYQLASKFTETFPITKISFEELVVDPQKIIKQIHFDLKIPYGVGRHRQEELLQFIEKRLIHHG